LIEMPRTAFRLPRSDTDPSERKDAMMRSTFAACVFAAATAPALAQSTGAIGFHVSRNDALPTEPHLGSLTLSTFSGPLGVRLNGGLHFTEREPDEFHRRSRLGIGAWTADADLVIAPFRPFGGISPYGFIGIGGQGVRFPDLPDSSLATWSYGAGLSLPLAGALSIDGDARYRRPLDEDRALPGGFAHDWEYRLGLTIGFGSRRSRAYHRRAPARSRTPVHTERERSSRSRVHGSALVSGAERYVGTRYRYGGDSPSAGFDCSGFVQYAYRRQGVALPRTSAAMAREGERLSLRERELRAGDLMFFADDGRRIDHVAIYAGGGRILHSTASGGGVRYDDLDSPRGQWFVERWVEARRVVNDGRPLVRDFDGTRKVDEADLDPPDRAPLPSARK
jgi:cell wall-associated NlpC family hydrolase